MILGGCLIVAPLALGGAHALVNVSLTALLVSALVFYVARMGKRARLEVNAPIVLIAAALIASLAQLVPLPLAVIASLAPKTHDFLTLDPNRTSEWAAVSLDPPATAHECIKLIGYLSAALLALMLFSHGQRRRQLLTWAAAALGAVVLVGLVHALLGWDRPYDFGPPSDSTVFVSSFVNPNHLAAHLGFSSLATLGLALSSSPPRRWFFALLAAIGGAGLLLTLSRGGIITYTAALAFFAVVALIQPRRTVKHVLLVQLVLVAVVVLAGFAAYSQLVHELWTLGSPNAFDKTKIWRIVPAILDDAPWTGIGRGAFATVHPHYAPAHHTKTFTHLENEWLQLFVDWGLIVGPILVGLGMLSMVQLVRRVMTGQEGLGVVSAVLFIAVSNIGDFSLALSSVGLAISMCLAVFVGRRPSDGGDVGKTAMWLQRSLGARGTWVVVGLLLVAVLSCAWPAIVFDLPRDEQRLERLLAQSGSQAVESEQDARTLVARHPADYLLPLRVGLWHLEGDGRARAALPWINRSMYLAPRFGLSHRLAGRALLRLGATQQALLEYRLACENAPSEIASIAEEVWSSTQSLNALERLAPEQGGVRLEIAWALIRRGAPERAARLLESVERPLSGHELEVTARAHIDMQDYERAFVHARAAERLNPLRVGPYYHQASALDGLRKPAEALIVLERGLLLNPHSTTLHSARAFISFRHGDLPTARKAAHTVLEHALSDEDYAGAYELLGQIYEAEKQYAKALREYQRARETNRTNVRHWLQIIRLRHTIGDITGAQRELEQARQAVDDTDRLQEEVKRLRLAREDN
jgi:tetratricopeptide (TPR) repeat protein